DRAQRTDEYLLEPQARVKVHDLAMAAQGEASRRHQGARQVIAPAGVLLAALAYVLQPLDDLGLRRTPAEERAVLLVEVLGTVQGRAEGDEVVLEELELVLRHQGEVRHQ